MYKLNEEKMFYDVADDVAVVINLITGVYYGFNGFGTAVLDGLLNGAGCAQIAESAKQFDGCPDNIEQLIAEFIRKLEEKEILIKTCDDEQEITLSQEAVKESFVPEMEEYSEVQDLILADPIHEVDEQKGWPNIK